MTDLHPTELLIRRGLASKQDLESFGLDAVRRVKSQGAQLRASKRRGPQSHDSEKRQIDFALATDHRDRMGDVIRIQGVDAKGLKVWLWAHDDSLPPIGRVERTWKGKTDDGHNGLFTRVKFHDAEKSEFADLIYRMHVDGDLDSSSIGFVPLESKAMDDSDSFFGPMEYLKSEALEGSSVTVPANPQATMKKLDLWAQEGVFAPSLVREFREVYPMGKDEADARVAAKVRSFVDMGRKSAPVEPEHSETPQDEAPLELTARAMLDFAEALKTLTEQVQTVSASLSESRVERAAEPAVQETETEQEQTSTTYAGLETKTVLASLRERLESGELRRKETPK